MLINQNFFYQLVIIKKATKENPKGHTSLVLSTIEITRFYPKLLAAIKLRQN